MPKRDWPSDASVNMCAGNGTNFRREKGNCSDTDRFCGLVIKEADVERILRSRVNAQGSGNSIVLTQ